MLRRWLERNDLPTNLAFTYLAVSALWILCSDGLVRLLQLPPGPSQLLHTAKGWFFVTFTGFLLYRTLNWWQKRQLSAERALAESESRLRQMADNVQEVFWLTDPGKTEVLFVSSAYAWMWGQPCETLYANPQSWLDLVVEEDRERVRAAIVGQAEGRFDVTYRIRTPAGLERWIHDRAFAIADEHGKVFRIAGVASDITQQRRAGQALRESEERYRCLVELSPEGIATEMGGRLAFVNPALVKLLGATREEEIVGRPMLALIHSDDRAAAEQCLNHVERGEGVLEPQELRFMRLNGQVFAGELLAVPFRQGFTNGALALIRDIGERKKIASALEQQRSHLQAIIQNSSDCIVAVDHHGQVLWFNPAAERCFGSSSEQACGRPWGHFFEARGPVGIRANGERFPAEATESSVNLVDGPVKTVVLRDFSERLRGEQKRKDLEQQLRHSQKMEALGLLAGGVAHDFNNLLTVVLGAASLIEPARPEDKENLDEIHHSAQRAADLTRQLLTFSRKQVIQLQDLDVSEVLGNIVAMLRRLVGEQIALTTDFRPKLAQIRADAGMLEQVLVNLVVNSRDALAGAGRLHISTSEVVLKEPAQSDVLNALPGRYVCLEVQDDGPGIDPKDLPHIFEPFYTTKEVGKGTGLGLATVYGIMEQHEGGLQVLSQPGQGTRVRALFPALSAARAGRPRTAQLHLARGTGKVLVAEDDLALQALIRRILERCGYEVVTANNGVEALELWREQHQSIDFLVTDLVMPGGISGLELGRRLLEEKADLKVIYSSGYSTDLLDARTALTAGDCFLPKPYTPVQLAQAMHDCACTTK